jgi:hypothetical protein
MTLSKYILNHMSKSSLFIFHSDNFIRKYFIKLTTSRGDQQVHQDTLLS